MPHNSPMTCKLQRTIFRKTILRLFWSAIFFASLSRRKLPERLWVFWLKSNWKNIHLNAISPMLSVSRKYQHTGQSKLVFSIFFFSVQMSKDCANIVFCDTILWIFSKKKKLENLKKQTHWKCSVYVVLWNAKIDRKCVPKDSRLLMPWVEVRSRIQAARGREKERAREGKGDDRFIQCVKWFTIFGQWSLRARIRKNSRRINGHTHTIVGDIGSRLVQSIVSLLVDET